MVQGRQGRSCHLCHGLHSICSDCRIIRSVSVCRHFTTPASSDWPDRWPSACQAMPETTSFIFIQSVLLVVYTASVLLFYLSFVLTNEQCFIVILVLFIEKLYYGLFWLWLGHCSRSHRPLWVTRVHDEYDDDVSIELVFAHSYSENGHEC